MRLALSILGTEVLAVEFGPTEAEDDDSGSFTSYPVGFVRDPEVPWEDRGSFHQFDPDVI